MAKVLVISGSNHNFDKCAPLIHAGLAATNGLDATLSDDKSILAGTGLHGYDVLVLGTGFTRRERYPDGTSKIVDAMTSEESRGVFDFVRGGKGFVGIHGTGWSIGGEAIALCGGHANWHPPGLEFTVNVDDREHQITRGIGDFDVNDEIYMSAWDPSVHVLATATWSERKHPMAWTHAYGTGRVFFTTLGHGPGTFENPSVLKLLGNAATWAASRG